MRTLILQSLRRVLLCAAGIFLLSDVSAQPVRNRLGGEVTYRGFFSNYEYFNPIVPGYTWFGNTLEPGLLFYRDTTWQLFAGAWLQHDFGRAGFRRAEPNIRLTYNKPHWQLRFGNVDLVTTGLSPWLFDPDDFITRGPAYGLQIKTRPMRLTSNNWIAWRTVIYPESTGQERFEAGSSALVNVLDTATAWQIRAPVQFVLIHQGGQIGTIDSAARVVTWGGASAGLQLGRRFTNSPVEHVRVHATAAIANNGDRPYIGNGYATYTAAQVAHRSGVSLEAGYWYAQDFFFPIGAPLYQSRSSVYAKEPVYRATRRLAMLTMEWNRRWQQGISVHAWLQPYFDVNLEQLEYAYRLRLTYEWQHR